MICVISVIEVTEKGNQKLLRQVDGGVDVDNGDAVCRETGWRQLVRGFSLARISPLSIS
jgi:hypothetical protein